MLSAFKNFLVTFLIAALIFGTVGFFMSRYLAGVVSDILDGEKNELEEIISTPDEGNDNTDKPKPSDPNEKVPEGDSFTLLVIGTDYRSDLYKDYYHSAEDIDKLTGGLKDSNSTVGILGTKVRRINATWMTLIRADKENREYVVCYISPETCVSTPAGDATLGDVYGRYGASVLCEYVEAMTQLRIDHSFIVDGINGSDFISSMGSVDLEVRHDIFSNGAYHVSSSASIVTEEETSAPESSSESTESKKSDKDDEKKDKKEKKDNKDEPEEAKDKTVDNVLVLKAGTQSLSDYSVHILNTFKELSGDDVGVKSTYILDIVGGYLKRSASWSEDELTAKLTELCREKNYSDGNIGDTPVNGTFDDPYASKPVLATDLTTDELLEMRSMLEAVEYFGYTEYTYPGTYSADTSMYMPDTTAALEFFAKYAEK